MSGSLVSSDTRAKVRAAAVPIAVALGRIGLTPNALTLIGFGIAVIAAYAAAQQAWLAAGLLVIGGGVFDLFDGALARAQGRANRLGAFMDSVFDRAGEAVIFIGLIGGLIGVGYADVLFVAAAALGTSALVPYTRAKSEGLGFTPGTGMAAVGLAPREVRIVILTLGLLGAGLLGTDPFANATCQTCAGGAAIPLGALALEAALGLITILSTITTIQRIVHVIQQDRQQGQ